MAVGVYSAEAGVLLLGALLAGRFPRARPEPRVLPNVAAADDAGVVAVASAEAPDDSVDDMSIYVVGWERLPRGGGAGSVASRSSIILLNPSTKLGANSGNNGSNVT